MIKHRIGKIDRLGFAEPANDIFSCGKIEGPDGFLDMPAVGEIDCARLEWMVLDWNGLAIEFYETLGARPVEGWTVFRVQGDALKKLAE